MQKQNLICDPSLEKTRDGYCIVDITDEMISEAQKISDHLGVLNNSIRKGQGNLAGILGEMAVQKAIMGAQRENTFDNDIRVGSYKIEVKTKDRTIEPKPEYEVSIADYNPTQTADYYAFVSLLKKDNRYVRAYILGYYPTGEYYKHAHFFPEGAHDSSNQWVAKADCYNMLHSRLCVFE